MLHELRRAGATMLVVTHNVTEGLAVATQATVMLAGRFASTEPVAGLDAVRFAEKYRALAGVETAAA
jgi:ABC-type sugar transport system ATPase subunit